MIERDILAKIHEAMRKRDGRQIDLTLRFWETFTKLIKEGMTDLPLTNDITRMETYGRRIIDEKIFSLVPGEERRGLTKLEIAVLGYFIKHQSEEVPLKSIIEFMNSQKYRGSEDHARQVVCRLRQAWKRKEGLGLPVSYGLKTVWNRGYKLIRGLDRNGF